MRALFALVVSVPVSIFACGGGSSSATSDATTDAPPDVRADDDAVANDAITNDTACPEVVALDAAGVEPLAGALDEPQALFVDPSNVYFTTSTAVLKMPKSGGVPLALATAAAIGPLVIDADTAYFVADGELRAAPLAGGDVRTVASAISGAWNLAVDATSVYWSDGGHGSIDRVSKAGGTPESIASGDELEPSVVAVDSVHLFWIDRFGPLQRSALDGTQRVALAQLAADSTPVLALDSTHVFWGLNGYLSQVDKAGGPTIALVADYAATGAAIAVDDAFVYYVTLPRCCVGCTPAVTKQPVGGGTATPLAPIPVPDVRALAVDDGYVYWAATGEAADAGAIFRAPK